MLKINLVDEFNLIQRFSEMTNSFKERVIQNSLDNSIDTALEELKKQLSYIINEKIPHTETTKNSNTLGLPDLTMPAADVELLKHFTGIDIDKIRNTKDYTSGIESNVAVSDNYRLRLRLPISEYESVEENYEKAVKFFNNSMIVFKSPSGEIEYYLNPGMDMRQYVKIVCSRENGVTIKSSNKFEHYKNSNKMTRQSGSEIGRFAEWSLKQDGVKLIKQSFINTTPAIQSIKEGNYDKAISILGGNKNGTKVQDLINKTKDLKDNNNLKPSTTLYNDIINLIKNLKIQKVIKEKNTEYQLLTKYSGNDDSKFFEEMDRALVLWKIDNEQVWIKAMMDIVDKVIAEYEG